MFVFNKNNILVHEEKSTLPESFSHGEVKEYRGVKVIFSEEVPEGYEYRDMRYLLGVLPDEQYKEALFALAAGRWDSQTRYCGCCGSPNKMKSEELAKVCTSCGHMTFPSISPAIIVAVTKGDELLLAHNANFRDGLYSVLAGFVDPGETLEEAVHREVLEEVGIRIHNVKYFTSQSWPFSSSIMLGFTAEYLSGDINPDGTEIVHADWFKGEMPELPPEGTISRQLISNYHDSLSGED